MQHHHDVCAIQWDFGSLECVRLLYTETPCTETPILEVILFEEWITLIIISKKLPLGGQNADFMLLKINNRLVNHFLSRNSSFLFHS